MSGEGEDYSDDEVNELYDELGEAFEDYYAAGGQTHGEMNVQVAATARIEWSGEYANNSRGGVRTTTMAPMNLAPVRDALRRAQRLEALAARGPLRSYTAKGWHAQLRQLQHTQRGQEALREAGATPSRETLRRWGKGEQAPSRANRERIAEAYDAARNPGRGWADARRDVANALTEVTRQAGGGFPVRFRDIEGIRFR